MLVQKIMHKFSSFSLFGMKGIMKAGFLINKQLCYNINVKISIF